MAARASKVIDKAVVRNDADASARLLDKAFAFAFKRLVYAQIWEDPVADMAALEITPDCRVLTIASGGCNAFSYLTANPASVTAVDLNTAHVALGRLKIEAIRQLPDHAHLRRFFTLADDPANLTAYREMIAPHLDDVTRRYWEGRDLIGRRRIGGFGKGIYKRGLLGNFIGVAHLLARIYRIDLKAILAAETLEEQREVFKAKIAPVFERRFVRWLTRQPASLFGLGIPPAQYDALAGEEQMAQVLRQRLEKLSCHFAINDNYFAWQAFSRGYGRAADASVPPYLEETNHAAVRERVDRVEVLHANFAEHLGRQPDESHDRYILLDAQDWMSDAQLTELWRQITRTARSGARVLFRTAAEPTLLPGRVPEAILSRWDYSEQEARRLIATDRSSIYGGMHLYRLKP